MPIDDEAISELLGRVEAAERDNVREVATPRTTLRHLIDLAMAVHDDEQPSGWRRWFMIVGLSLVAVALILGVVSWWGHVLGLPVADAQKAGVAGDAVAWITAAVTVLVLAVAVYTATLQRHELALQRKEMRRSWLEQRRSARALEEQHVAANALAAAMQAQASALADGMTRANQLELLHIRTRVADLMPSLRAKAARASEIYDPSGKLMEQLDGPDAARVRIPKPDTSNVKVVEAIKRWMDKEKLERPQDAIAAYRMLTLAYQALLAIEKGPAASAPAQTPMGGETPSNAGSAPNGLERLARSFEVVDDPEGTE